DAGRGHLDDVLAKGREGERPGRARVHDRRRPGRQAVRVGLDPIVRGTIEDVHVQVDEAWSDVETARVDDLVARRGRQVLGDRRDTAAGERDVADGMKAVGRG